MRVVHDEKQGRSLGEVGGNPVQPMEHGLHAARRRLRPRFGAPVAVEYRTRAARRTGQQLFPLRWCGSDEHRLEELARDSERKLSLQLATLALKGLELMARGHGVGKAQHLGLPDAGRPLHQYQRTVAQRQVAQQLP